MQEPTKRKKLTVLIVSAFAAIAILVTLIQYNSSDKPVVNNEMIELVAKYNKNCPLTIQKGIRLDSVSLPELSEERAVQYNLTLMNVEKETAEISVIHTEIEKSLLSTAKANPGLQVFIDNDYTLIYSYKDKKKVFLFDVKILPDQYK